jgi:hypothetical protein
MTKPEISVLVKLVGSVVRDYVAQSLTGIVKQLEAHERKLSEIPAGAKGDKGERGEPGQGVDMAEVRAMVDNALQNYPLPQDGRDGINGKDAEPVDVDSLIGLISSEVQLAVSKIPVPKDGIDGRDAEPIHPDTIARLVADEVRKAVAALPKAIDGAAGKDGAPGRDALQIEILSAIDPEKSYPRGTFARHANGLIRAFRNTTAISGDLEKSGWEVMFDGHTTRHEQDAEDPRVIWAISTMTSGTEIRSKFFIPAMLNKGIFDTRSHYVGGDVVTYDGSAWHCEKDGTTNKPGDGSGDWKLIVKRGRDGKDGNPPAPPPNPVVRVK